MFTKWSFERCGVYVISLHKVAEIKIDIKKKMAKEEEHWEVGNSNMIMSHKKDGKLWLSYF
jgi:hypothetical protein